MIPPSEIQELFAPLLQELYAVKNPRTNKPIKFSTKGHTYLYFRGKDGNDYCYTPHPDQDGWYYSFAYIGQGAGSRTGKAKKWPMKRLQPHRLRKAAKTRALRMQSQASKKDQSKIAAQLAAIAAQVPCTAELLDTTPSVEISDGMDDYLYEGYLFDLFDAEAEKQAAEIKSYEFLEPVRPTYDQLIRGAKFTEAHRAEVREWWNDYYSDANVKARMEAAATDTK